LLCGRRNPALRTKEAASDEHAGAVSGHSTEMQVDLKENGNTRIDQAIQIGIAIQP